jgi:hypothetical protein
MVWDVVWGGLLMVIRTLKSIDADKIKTFTFSVFVFLQMYNLIEPRDWRYFGAETWGPVEVRLRVVRVDVVVEMSPHDYLYLDL